MDRNGAPAPWLYFNRRDAECAEETQGWRGTAGTPFAVGLWHQLRAELLFPPTAEVAPRRSNFLDKGSPRRTHRSRECGGALPQPDREPPGRSFATQATRHSPCFSHRRQIAAQFASLDFQNVVRS